MDHLLRCKAYYITAQFNSICVFVLLLKLVVKNEYRSALTKLVYLDKFDILKFQQTREENYFN
jgi:hypothetical protein